MADADGHAGAGERALMMREAHVWFPLTVAGSRCKLNRVEVAAYPQSHRGRKSCPSGKSGEVKQLLGYARHGEGIEAVEMDVVVHMDDLDFAEGSFGLALAIADKLARFGANANAQEIVATGIVGNQGGCPGSARSPTSWRWCWMGSRRGRCLCFRAPMRQRRSRVWRR